MPAHLCRTVLLLSLVALLLPVCGGCNPSPSTPQPTEETAGPNEVLLKITGADTDEHRKAIAESLKQKTDTPGNHSMRTNWSSGGPLVIRLSPVIDPEAFANRVDFGAVEKIEGRTLHITYHPTAMP